MPGGLVICAQWTLTAMLSTGSGRPADALPPREPLAQKDDAVEAEQSRRLVRAASRLVGLRSLRRVNPGGTDDCSGLVRYLFGREYTELIRVMGLPSSSAVVGIYLSAKAIGALRLADPKPGDLVFFRDTYDRNRNGRRDDGLTHIGLVETTDARTETLTFIHRSRTGVTRERMNLAHPTVHRDALTHEVENDYVRSLGKRPSPRLAGELFAGFGDAKTFFTTASVLQKTRGDRQRPGGRRGASTAPHETQAERNSGTLSLAPPSLSADAPNF